MKKKIKFFTFLVSCILLISVILPQVVSANDDSNTTINDVSQENIGGPSPITDISKAVPFSHPLDNLLNPASPKYNPALKHGKAGTRFGPPGQRSNDIPFNESSKLKESQKTILGVGHRWFGTGILTYTNAIGFYAKQQFQPTQINDFGTTLYAPTLLGSNYCPLEISTTYEDVDYVRYCEIKVFDHTLGDFQFSLTAVSPYLEYSNGSYYYYADIIKSGNTWYALLYNVSNTTWEIVYSQSSSTSSPYGWDIWEEWYFDESPWPTLDNRFSTVDLQIRISGGLFTPITSTYGSEQKDVGTAPYSFQWVNNYYNWYVED